MRRFGIIGTGLMARFRANALRTMEKVTLAAVFSRTEERASRFAKDYEIDVVVTDLDEISKLDLDAVLVETPNITHHRYIIWALTHGLNVFTEGPLCVTVPEAEEIIRLAKKSGKIVEVGFDYRYNAVIDKAKEILDAGKIGDPIIAYSTAMIPMWKRHNSWYYSEELSGGMPLAHMSYGFINVFRWLLGNPITVYAQANKKVYTEKEKVKEETCTAILKWPNSALASISASYAAPKAFPRERPKIICTQGGLVLGNNELVVHQGSGITKIKPPRSSSLLETFVMCIETRTEGRNPPSDAIIDVKIATSISESCKTGNPISI